MNHEYNKSLHNVKRAPAGTKIRVGSYLAVDGAWDRKYIVTKVSFVSSAYGTKVGSPMKTWTRSRWSGPWVEKMVSGILQVEAMFIGRYYATGRHVAPKRMVKPNVQTVWMLDDGTLRYTGNLKLVVPR